MQLVSDLEGLQCPNYENRLPRWGSSETVKDSYFTHSMYVMQGPDHPPWESSSTHRELPEPTQGGRTLTMCPLSRKGQTYGAIFLGQRV